MTTTLVTKMIKQYTQQHGAPDSATIARLEQDAAEEMSIVEAGGSSRWVSPLEGIVARCSKFSGFDLQYQIDKSILTIWDPKDYHRSVLKVTLLLPEVRGSITLREVYGRLRQYGITSREEEVMAKAIWAAGG